MKNPSVELRNYLNRLIHRLLFIKSLIKQLELIKNWETPNRISALQLGSSFYSRVVLSFNRTILIELCMLVDEREKRSIVDWLAKAKVHAKTLNLNKSNRLKGVEELIAPEIYKIIVTEHEELISNKKEIIDKIIGRRDKSLAHSDAKYFNNPDDVYKKFPLGHDEIKELVLIISDILSTHYSYLFGSHIDIDIKSSSNVDKVLKYSRAFKRVRKDKRMTNFYPIHFELDDYESKVQNWYKKNN